MADLTFEISKIEPLDTLNPADSTAVTVFLALPSEVPNTSHGVELRLILARDEGSNLATLSEKARVLAAKVLAELATHVGDTDLATLISQSRMDRPAL